MEENANFCPICGKSVKEPVEVPTENSVEESVEEIPVEEKKKSKTWKIVLAAVGGVALLAVLVGAVLYGLGIDFKPRANDVYYKDSYTVSDEKAEKDADVVVAQMGNQTLTNGELQAHYWLGVYDFVDYYGYYLEMMGLDVAKPLDQQVQDEKTGMTYQQMFLENAMESWRRYAALAEMAAEANYTLTEDIQAYLDTFEAQLKTAATEAGYDDVEKYLDEKFFPGSSVADYYAYTKMTYTALGYYDTLHEGMLPTQDEIEAYYTKNEATLKGQGYGKDAGNYYDVRHILIEVEGTKGEDGKVTSTDADWEACRVKAQKLLDDYLAGEVTEDAFAELAKKNSTDTGSAANGGLYTQLTKDTNFVDEFKNWYLEEGRKPGDTGLVKSVYGYHIMYFSGSTPIWEYEVNTIVLSEKTNELLKQAESRWPMEVDYKKIILGEVKLTEE